MVNESRNTAMLKATLILAAVFVVFLSLIMLPYLLDPPKVQMQDAGAHNLNTKFTIPPDTEHKSICQIKLDICEEQP